MAMGSFLWPCVRITLSSYFLFSILIWVLGIILQASICRRSCRHLWMLLIRITFAFKYSIFGMIIKPKGYVVPSDKLGSKDVCCLPRLCWLNIGFWGRYVKTGSGTKSSHYREETQVFLGIIDAWISSVDDWLVIQKFSWNSKEAKVISMTTLGALSGQDSLIQIELIQLV